MDDDYFGTAGKTLTLFELNNMVANIIAETMSDEYWVEAELSEVRESKGHCYMELIEKEPAGNTPIARAQAKCWRQTWTLLRAHFERVTRQMLHAGLKVRLKVYAQFHEAYGFSWLVTDIDASFTIGDMARKRMEIVKRLKDEGVFDLNRELPIPMFAQRIAVISSATAAGYGDFCRQLCENEYGFAFTTQLFQAVMQGEKIESSIIMALNEINRRTDDFDCVVIIRGGGATSDMSGFDSLVLAENVANFPLPIITGIGHDRDETVLDMVSNTRVKTPTAAAALLISRLKATADRIDECSNHIVRTVTMLMQKERMRMTALSERLPSLFSVVKTRREARLDMMAERLLHAVERRTESEKRRIDLLENAIAPLTERIMTAARHRLGMLSQRTSALDPALLLKRGYSITLHNGRAVRDAGELKPGDKIETRLNKGKIKSEVI
ncbi:MAG: exodeoxyribonuclease VII large subunit [Prevotella sp.]